MTNETDTRPNVNGYVTVLAFIWMAAALGGVVMMFSAPPVSAGMFVVAGIVFVLWLVVMAVRKKP